MDFESHIQGHKPVVVEYYADWCKPCELLIPVLQQVKETAGDRATILRINIDEDKSFADAYQVYTVPTLIVFREGNIVWRKNGISSSHEILDHLNLLME
ncbi:MAG TPA: thioredoxin family protein [Flavisolibacter sp.]|nr:thioredoxin family protein [Flavisolibacter sp.]